MLAHEIVAYTVKAALEYLEDHFLVLLPQKELSVSVSHNSTAGDGCGLLFLAHLSDQLQKCDVR